MTLLPPDIRDADGASTLVNILLDATGSMAGREQEVVDGINKYLKELRADQHEYKVTLRMFDSERYFTWCRRAPLEQARDMALADYVTGAATPLIDCSVRSIHDATDDARALHTSKVITLIFTDGLENASREWKQEQLTSLINEKEAEGWAFVYMGTAPAAWNQNVLIGTASAGNASQTRGYSDAAIGSSVASTSAYAAGAVTDALAEEMVDERSSSPSPSGS